MPVSKLKKKLYTISVEHNINDTCEKWLKEMKEAGFVYIEQPEIIFVYNKDTSGASTKR